jgi:hypothetical protein
MGRVLYENLTLDDALDLLDRSKNFRIGIQLNNN